MPVYTHGARSKAWKGWDPVIKTRATQIVKELIRRVGDTDPIVTLKIDMVRGTVGHYLTLMKEFPDMKGKERQEARELHVKYVHALRGLLADLGIKAKDRDAFMGGE